MNPLQEHQLQQTRRHFLGRTGSTLGLAALASLLTNDLRARAPKRRPACRPERTQACGHRRADCLGCRTSSRGPGT